MVDFLDDVEVSGPDVDEIHDYEIPTGEQGDEAHPAHDHLKQFAMDIARKQNADSAERYYLGLKPYVTWLDLEHGRHDLFDAATVVGDYFKWLVNMPWGQETRKSYFTAVQRFYSWAAKEGPLAENPVEGHSIDDYTIGPGAIEESRRESGDAAEYKYVDKETIEQLWQPDNIPAPKSRNELLIKLMFYTTCRTSAVAEMQLEPEGSPGENPVKLNREIGAVNVPNLKKGKNQDDYRWVFYPRGEIEPLLVEWLDVGRRDTIGPYGPDSDYLFLTHQSPQMRPSHISRIVKEAAFNAGVQEVSGYDVHGEPRWLITGHCVRHSAATWYANECPPIELHFLKKQLGHSKIETTMKYVHDDPQARLNAFQRAWNS